MWHCPHCGAPQAETARCWVCRRSSTTCSTCRHFRPSLATEIGYCALDRARRPLTGLELRGCWTQRPAAADPQAGGEAPAAQGSGIPPASAPAAAQEWAPVRGFVPLDELARVAAEPVSLTALPIMALAEAFDSGEVRTSLFGELDR